MTSEVYKEGERGEGEREINTCNINLLATLKPASLVKILCYSTAVQLFYLNLEGKPVSNVKQNHHYGTPSKTQHKDIKKNGQSSSFKISRVRKNRT